MVSSVTKTSNVSDTSEFSRSSSTDTLGSISDEDTTNSNTTKPPDKEQWKKPKSLKSVSLYSIFGGFKFFLLLLMVLQNSVTVLMGRYTRSSVSKDQLFEVNHLILLIESTKFTLSCAFESYETGGKLLHSLYQHVFKRPVDALKMAVPAMLYLVQKSLLYVALSNLSAPLFQVTFQGKLVTTALVSVFMLGRTYSFRQWMCLVCLSLGVAIVVLGEQEQQRVQLVRGNLDEVQWQQLQEHHQNNLFLGLCSVGVGCFSSAFAGVYFEKVVKNRPVSSTSVAGVPEAQPASIWMRNIQLAFYSVLIAASQEAWEAMRRDGKDHSEMKPYLHGFTCWVWILVVLQAAGGLLVAAVVKYADNVLKGLATGVSVVVATSFSSAFFHTPLSTEFFSGATIILSSVYFFNNPLPIVVCNKQAQSDRLPLTK